MKKILNTLGNVLLTILVMLLIGYGWAFFEIKIMLKTNPELFGYMFYQQKSNDMENDFHIDDIIIIKKNDTYQAGDIVMYLTKDNEKKIHRVISTDAVSTVTKCNTCETNNAPIDNSTVLGRAVGKISYFGKFINFFKKKAVLITIAIIGFACVVISQYIKSKPVKKVASTE